MYKLNITNEDLKNIDIEDIKEYIKYIEKLTNIIWKVIPDFENYIISEYGDIINIKYKRILKLFLDKDRYYQVNLYKNNIRKGFRIHRLVYSIFLDKDINSKDKIYFKDENKNNIHYTNLSSEFTLPKNLINLKSILCNNNYNNNSNNITNIPKPIEYEDLKKIIDKCKSDNITDFIKNLQKDTKLEWRIIPDYNNYIISEYGDVINLEYRDILRSYINKVGYYQIVLFKNNIRKTFKTHRLVYSAFLYKDIKGFDIHHRDENKLNNHYSNLQKIIRSKHTKYHCNLESEEYLKRCKEYYNLRYKENLSIEEIAKRYNISGRSISYGIQQYKVYLSNNEDINKYNSSNIKEKKDFYTNVILKEDKRKELKEYLRKCEQLYNKKNKENLSNKELSKIYHVSKRIIRSMNKDIKIYIFLLDRNFDKFYNLSKKEKLKLRKKISTIERKKELKEYLKKAEQLYNKKNKEHLTYKQLSKIYNLSIDKIARYIQEIKFYIFLLDRNFDKFYNLTKKEKRKLRKKISTIDKQNNNILDIGKQIEDLKLSGVSNKDIANRLNLSINRISDIYKKYKKLINDRKIKNELKSIKTKMN